MLPSTHSSRAAPSPTYTALSRPISRAPSLPTVIDLSHHNADPDFAAAKAAGLRAVALKATQGVGYVDPKFNARRVAAAEAGLPTFSYHFLEAGNATAQMKHYLATSEPAIGERVVIDHEPLSGKAAPTLADLKEAVSHLRADERNLQVTVYSGSLVKTQLAGRRDSLLARTDLWIAEYTDDPAPTWPVETWSTWTLWQYTDRATFPGMPGRVDGSVFNYAQEAGQAWGWPAASGRVSRDVPDPPR